jgi:predicted AAA+ superfamily ATPase
MVESRMKRYLEPFVLKDLKSKVVLLSGPRQVGKTTLSKQLGTNFAYLNFDVSEDRKIILKKEWDRDCELVFLMSFTK